ncbi:Holliday junction recognition protein isoform 2-T2 [Acridotheres tristis]
MDQDAAVQEGLRRSNARFMASISRIMERYNHPFEDDLLVSMDTLTYDTPEGPKRWGQVSRKDVKKWKKEIFKHNRRSRRNREISKQQSTDSEDEHSTVHQESPESSGVDTSGTGGESGDIVSVRRKLEDIQLQNLNVGDGQSQKKEVVEVDWIVQAGEKDIPKWITIPSPHSPRRRRLTSPVREPFGGESGDTVSARRKLKDVQLQNLNVGDGQSQKKEVVEVDWIVQAGEKDIPKWITIPSPHSPRRRRLTSPVREPFGGESGDTVLARRKLKDVQLQNLNVGDGQSQKKEVVEVDWIVQAGEKDIPKWITIPSPHSPRRRRLTSPVREPFGGESGDTVLARRKLKDVQLQNLNVGDGQSQKKEVVEVDWIVQAGEKDIPKWITIPSPHSPRRRHLTSPVREPFGGESGDTVLARRKLKDVQLQNLNVGDGQSQKKEVVEVDWIVQAGEKDIPKWITITPPRLSRRHHLTSPVREPFGNQAAVCRKKLELSNDCSSSKYLQLQLSDAPGSSNKIASPMHQPCPELSSTLYDSIHGEYQSADEECSWSNTTLADLYPGMLEIFTELMTKHSQRKVFKYMFGQLRSKRWHSRRPKLNVTLDKMRGFRPSKLKKGFHSTCSCRSDDNQSPTFGNEGREFSCDSCLISSSSGLVPYASSDTNEIKMGYSNASLEHLTSGKGQEVYKHTAFPDVMVRMGQTSLVQDDLQTPASPKNSEYVESEKLAYKRFSEPSFITSTASSDSRVLHLVKESETQKTDFCVGTLEFNSSTCSSSGNRNNSIPILSCSPARSSNTAFIYPEKIISKRQTSFQHKGLFSSWFMKQNPSKMPNEYEDAFEELYYKVCSEEFQKSLTLTRPLINSQNPEEKGRLVKSDLSNFRQSMKQMVTEFDKIYGKLCRNSVPKFPGFQTASNFRKYEEIQMPETVNAVVNSPVETYSAISKVKRRENFQNYLLCSPVKRLKLTPGHSSSKKCQEVSPSEKGHLQGTDTDFLSTYDCSNPCVFGHHSCHCQNLELQVCTLVGLGQWRIAALSEM